MAGQGDLSEDRVKVRVGKERPQASPLVRSGGVASRLAVPFLLVDTGETRSCEVLSVAEAERWAKEDVLRLSAVDVAYMARP